MNAASPASVVFLQGREPWNKGRTMSVETRAKMAAAKAGLLLRKGVRAKMSRAHMGKTHTEVPLLPRWTRATD